MTYEERTAEPSDPRTAEQSEEDQELLQEIRDRYRYAADAWHPIQDEGAIDMRFVAGDPWEHDDRKARADAGRPCINHDELNQYVNQAANNLRQNPRGIKVDPSGNGADEKLAEYRQNRIRAIEAKSAASMAYACAFENALQRSYGWLRVRQTWESDRTFHQELSIAAFLNPDAILYDPDCKQPDWSDPEYVFVLEPMPRDEFKRKYPDAQTSDFTAEHMRTAPDWIQDKNVLVAEYWKAVYRKRTLVELEMQTQTPAGPGVKTLAVFKDEIDASMAGAKPTGRTRQVHHRSLVQYLTNGVEILETNEYPDYTLIPIIPVLGKEMWLLEGGQPTRKMISLVRFARDPQMSHAYLCSQEMEEAGLTPKTPFIGYKGQFESDQEAWETVNKIPRAFLQADPIVDAATGQVLPLPQRQPFQPNFEAYEMAKESCRRAIQSAMGIMPLPTAAQRQNEKSGVALQRIQSQQAIGSFHFTDNLDRALHLCGRILLERLPSVENSERDVAIRHEDDRHEVVRINTPQPYADAKGEQHHYPIADDDGTYDLTISTGPSFQSQREEASDFLNTLIANLKVLPLAPQQAQKLLSLAIQMKQLGPKGDQMAEIISPTDQQQEMPPQAQQAIAGLQQQMQAIDAYAKQKDQEIQELQQKLDAKVVDNEYKVQIERMRIEKDLAVAEIGTKAQIMSERMELVVDLLKQLHVSAHERGMQAGQLEHDASQADMQRRSDADQADAQRTHEQDQAVQAQAAAAAQQQTQQEQQTEPA